MIPHLLNLKVSKNGQNTVKVVHTAYMGNIEVYRQILKPHCCHSSPH